MSRESGSLGMGDDEAGARHRLAAVDSTLDEAIRTARELSRQTERRRAQPPAPGAANPLSDSSAPRPAEAADTAPGSGATGEPTAELTAARAKLAVSETALAKALLREAQERESTRQLRAESERLEQELAAARRETAARSDVQSKLRAELERTQEDLAASRANLNKTLRNVHALTERFEPLRGRLKSSEDNERRLTVELDKIRSNLVMAEAALDDARRRTQTLTADGEAVRERLEEALHKESAAGKKLQSELDVLIAEARAPERQALQGELEAHRRELARLAENVASAQVRMPPPPAPAGTHVEGLADALTALLARSLDSIAKLRAAGAGTSKSGRNAMRAAMASLGALQEPLQTLVELFRQPPRPVRQDPGRLLAAVLKGWAPAFRAKGVTVERRVASSLPACSVHPERLRLALHQLLKNAYEAMPRGGRLFVELFPEPGGVRLRLTDSGPGFSDEVLGEPFKPFRARSGRMGLGLALAGRVAEGLGGELQISNVPEGGARVELRLPS